VELDLEGIFDQAKKEAEHLTADSTHVAAEAPKPEEAPAPEEPAPQPEPLVKHTQKKVSKLKLVFFLVPVGLGVAFLGFGLYNIFFSKAPAPEEEELVLVDPLSLHRELEPGEVPLSPFLLTLEGADGGRAVAQVDFVLHYHDSPDRDLINENLVEVRDLIYRVTKSRGPALLSDATARRQLQADLLSTLNSLPPFRSESEPRLTYVQISLLREK
jgi:flagellar basal body-associated protein FliL